MAPPRSRAALPASFVCALLALGILLTVTVIHGVFMIDDNNYLVNVQALRQGRVTVANTEGLTPSRELLFFDPAPWRRQVTRTPVGSVAPPLYAPIALPFSFFGWRGLVALNTLAYLLTTVLIFTYVRRYAQEARTPWIAAFAFALGSFTVEYAQGPWPHLLSIALCAAGVFAAGRLIDGGSLRLAPLAGLLLGVATGVRYQNAVLVAAVGLGLILWARRRMLVALTYSLAAVVPLAISALFNHARFDSWNPISKGPGYLAVPVLQYANVPWSDPFVMAWARIVDFSVRPPITGRDVALWVTYEPATGAHLMGGLFLQKALTQSAPWIGLALVALVLAWRNADAQRQSARQMRFLSLVLASVFAAFSLAGSAGNEGFVFNQRYLLETLPFLAIAVAWAVDGIAVRPRWLVVGGLTGVVLAGSLLFGLPIAGGPLEPLWLLRQDLLLKVPLAMAAVLIAAWLVQLRHARATPAVVLALAACLGWAAATHLLHDLFASRLIRSANLERTVEFSRVLGDRSALVTFLGRQHPVVPLLAERDIVLLDARADDARDAPVLIRELLVQGRRVYLLDQNVPPDVRARIVHGLATKAVGGTPLPLVELEGEEN